MEKENRRVRRGEGGWRNKTKEKKWESEEVIEWRETKGEKKWKEGALKVILFYIILVVNY